MGAAGVPTPVVTVIHPFGCNRTGLLGLKHAKPTFPTGEVRLVVLALHDGSARQPRGPLSEEQRLVEGPARPLRQADLEDNSQGPLCGRQFWLRYLRAFE